MKEFLIVGAGSFLGGGMRYLLSKAVQDWTAVSFPFGTMAVNVLGCLLLGFLSGLPWNGGGLMGTHTKLLLTTGFCGGFTTFSTFMNEGSLMLRDGHCIPMFLYIIGSLALGIVAVFVGHYLSRLAN